MNLNHTTVEFLIAAVVIIAVFDVVQLARGGGRATISHTLYAAGQRWPIIPFVFGTVAGHLFWPNA